MSVETLIREPRPLDVLREEIDNIDAEIIRLWAERNRIAEEVGLYKREAQAPVYVHGRDLEVRRAFADACADEGIRRDLGATVIGALMTTSYEIQRSAIIGDQLPAADQ